MKTTLSSIPWSYSAVSYSYTIASTLFRQKIIAKTSEVYVPDIAGVGFVEVLSRSKQKLILVKYMSMVH